MEQSNISEETKKLVKLFKYSKKLELIPWKDNEEAVGFSILREYPDRGEFIPTRNSQGKKDSVTMIRIWYLKNDIKKYRNQTRAKLQVSVNKASRYLFNHIFPNPQDPESPTETSVEKSKQSKQPIDLNEPNRYTLINGRKIMDSKINKNIKAKQVIENIYQEHLNTTRNYFFRSKIYIRQNVIDSIEPVKKWLLKINFYLFGKQIQKTDDFGIGVFSLYPYDKLIDNPNALKMKILGSDLPISYNSAITFTTFISLLLLIKYSFNYDLFGIIHFIENINNSFFLAVFTAEALWFLDFIIPRIILYIANCLIKFYLFLIDLKIQT